MRWFSQSWESGRVQSRYGFTIHSNIGEDNYFSYLLMHKILLLLDWHTKFSFHLKILAVSVVRVIDRTIVAVRASGWCFRRRSKRYGVWYQFWILYCQIFLQNFWWGYLCVYVSESNIKEKYGNFRGERSKCLYLFGKKRFYWFSWQKDMENVAKTYVEIWNDLFFYKIVNCVKILIQSRCVLNRKRI